MSDKLHRFDFGSLRDFRGPMVTKVMKNEAEIEAVTVVAPPPPTFTEAEMETAKIAIKKAGYNEGFKAGQDFAKAGQDQRTQEANTTIQNMLGKLDGITKSYHELLAREAVALSELALVIARKVAGEALDARNVETLTALITGCMPVMFSKPRLIIELHPDTFDSIQKRTEEHLRKHGFEGEILFRVNESLGKHDITLDWGVGNARRNTAVLWQEVEELLTKIPLELTFADTLNSKNPDTTA